MSKDKISDYSATANSNTDIGGINIDEGCAPSGINNAIRTLMKQIKDLYAGTSGDTWPVTAGGTGSGTASGARTNLGLGTISTQASDNVSITGGSVTGITDLAVADGGTGASTAANARTNLGLVIGTDVQAYDADLAAIASSGKGAEIASYGTYGVGFKNRIINGDMRIDQRNAGASVTNINGGVYSLDRWQLAGAAASKYTGQQSSNTPAGFTKSLLVTSSSAYTVGTNEGFTVRQNIEGFNVADLDWGTAAAKTVTLSFWVRSSLTGTFGGSIINNGFDRSYPFSYTISSANTWEQKSVTIAGDQSGTWTTDNTAGIRVLFGLGVGSGQSNTAGTWASGNYQSATGATSVVGTNGATFYITGVQLEKGSTATSFDVRPYGSELALCQRYYETGTLYYEGYADLGLATSVGGVSSFKVTKRAVPTMAYGTFSSGYHSAVGATRNVYVDMVQRYCNVITSTGECLGYEPWTASAEL